MSRPVAKGRKSPKAKACRFDARLNEEQKGTREAESFVDAILRPAEPGRVLRAAARHYNKTVGC